MGSSAATNTLFGAFFLALDRLQQVPLGDGTGVGEGVAMADPTAVEFVLRHWTLGDSGQSDCSKYVLTDWP